MKTDIKEVIVTVAGYPGVGKSTIQQVIVDALKAMNIEVVAPDLPAKDVHHPTRCSALSRHGIHVVVKTKQRRRQSREER